jgi:molecular chaperone DnaK
MDSDGPKHLEYRLTRKRFESICADLFDNIGRSCELLLADTELKPHQIDDVIMVGGATRITRVQTVAKEIFQRPQLNTSVNPDEVVGLGAGVLAGVIEGTLKNVALMDVTAHSLGVETANDRVQVLVPKNTPIPTTVSNVFTTPRNNQRSVPITVLEGESEQATENRPLGVFRLTRIRKAARGVPRIEVEFGLDADGILKVTATDQATGRTQDIVITDGCGLDESEIEEMKQAVAENAATEPEASPVDLANHANMVHEHMTNWLRHNHELIPLRTIDQIEKALRKLDRVLEKPTTAGLKASLKRIDSLMKPYSKAS